MASSFNAFGRNATEFGALHQPVWLGTVKPVPVGGVLAEAYRVKRLLIPAGAPVNFASGVITPLVAFKVVSFTGATGSETNDKIVIRPCVLGGVEYLPKAEDLIQKIGATFAATGKAAAVVSVTALTGADAGKYEVAVAHAATIDSVSAGDMITFSAAVSAGSGKSIKVQPNAYLYNDIAMGDLNEDLNATGAVVKFHGEGLLIDLTPSAEVAAQMAAAVPGVLQVTV